jgi:beta-mannanase
VAIEAAPEATGHINGYARLAKVERPSGFTEYGPQRPQNPPGDYVYPRFREGVKKYFPKGVFFMCWDGKWISARKDNVEDMLAAPWMVNRGDLPAGMVGTGK